jgi:uncharacterized protein YjbI with pentapeptide repeats
MLSKDDLLDRWITPQGAKLREQIIEELMNKNEDWFKALNGFTGVDEIKTGDDLRGINFSKLSFTGIELFGTRLDYSNLDGVSISDSILDWTDFTLASLRGVIFTNCRLNPCIGEGTCFAESQFINSDLMRSSFTNASFKKSIFENTNLGNCNLGNTDFTDATLKRVNLYSAWFYNTSFDNTIIEDTIFGMGTSGKKRKVSLINPKENDFLSNLLADIESKP